MIQVFLRLEIAIVVVTFLAMVIPLAADVIGRELFGKGVYGSSRFAVYAMIYCAMAGFGIATARGGHLRPKFLDWITSGSLERPATRAGQFASAAILVTLAWAGLTFIEQSMMFDERDVVLDWLVWPVKAALPAAFLMSAIRHLVYGIWPDLLPVEQGVAE